MNSRRGCKTAGGGEHMAGHQSPSLHVSTGAVGHGHGSYGGGEMDDDVDISPPHSDEGNGSFSGQSMSPLDSSPLSKDKQRRSFFARRGTDKAVKDKGKTADKSKQRSPALTPAAPECRAADDASSTGSSAGQHWSKARSAVMSPTTQVPVVLPGNREAYWMKDGDSSTCCVCDAEFGIFKRRHHCRLCGILVCAGCSGRAVYVQNHTKPQRICDLCYGDIQEGALDASKFDGGDGAPLPVEMEEAVNEAADVDNARLWHALPPWVYLTAPLLGREIMVTGILHIQVVAARNLVAADLLGKSDPYCVLSLVKSPTCEDIRTETVYKNLNPKWNHRCHIPVQYPGDTLMVKIFDEDVVNNDEHIGTCTINLLDIQDGDHWFMLSVPEKLRAKKNNRCSGGQIRLRIRYSYSRAAQFSSLCFHPPPAEKEVVPSFDIESLHQACVRLQILVMPILQSVWNIQRILAWQTAYETFLYLVVLLVLAWWPAWFPTVFFAWVAGMMCRKYVHNRVQAGTRLADHYQIWEDYKGEDDKKHFQPIALINTLHGTVQKGVMTTEKKIVKAGKATFSSPKEDEKSRHNVQFSSRLAEDEDEQDQAAFLKRVGGMIIPVSTKRTLHGVQITVTRLNARLEAFYRLFDWSDPPTTKLMVKIMLGLVIATAILPMTVQFILFVALLFSKDTIVFHKITAFFMGIRMYQRIQSASRPSNQVLLKDSGSSSARPSSLRASSVASSSGR